MPFYTQGESIRAGRTINGYSIYANTGSVDGPGIEFHGSGVDAKSGSLTFLTCPNTNNTDSRHGFTFAKYNGTTWKPQFAINRYGFSGFGDFAGWDVTAPLQVDKNFNRVGIGTLGVSSFGDDPQFQYRYSPSLTGGIGYIGFNAIRQVDNAIGMHSNGTNNGGAIIAGTINGGLNFITLKSGAYGGATGVQWASPAQLAASIKMSIDPDGKVGIGTLCVGNYKLAVDGAIRCREVRVDQDSWCDYVFEKDYKLLSLSQVESFIIENKHLPDVPSEKRLKKMA